MTPQELEHNLLHFSGTTALYQLYPQLKLTDGTKYLCEQAKCYWLMDIIWSCQTLAKVRKEAFQVYTLSVDLKKQQGALDCTDSNLNLLYRQKLAYTDFPLETQQIYFIDGIALLPSEY